MFNTCTPAAAPNAPVCGAPVLVTQVPHPIQPNFNILTPMVNVNMMVWTYPKHASRADKGGKITSFLIYEDCKNSFAGVCLQAEVLMTSSTDNGRTWATPTSVDTSAGHHFFSAIATDASTGTVNLAYYSTTGDKYNHRVQVVRNQIAPGATTPGTPQRVTTVLDPIDSDPQMLGSSLSDLYMGIIARGTGVTGQTHLYDSFDSTVAKGSYEGAQDAELNNHLSMISY
jgi:hypothetical protein